MWRDACMQWWTRKFRSVDRARFNEIRTGEKQYETRAATEKYRAIREGDTITFVCGKKRLEKEIAKVFYFRTPAAMRRGLPLAQVMPDLTTLAEVKARYASYPDYTEKIQKFGLLAFKLR